MPSPAQSTHKRAATLVVGPVGGIAVEEEMRKAARQEMVGYYLSGVGVVFKDARKVQVGPAETEVHGGLVLLFHEFRQLVPGTQPGQDAVAFPSPRHDFLTRHICGERPIVFSSIGLNAAMEPVIIPA